MHTIFDQIQKVNDFIKLNIVNERIAKERAQMNLLVSSQYHHESKTFLIYSD